MKEVELYPHQISAVSRLHNGSILCGGVGAGKSRVAMKYYMEKEFGKDVYVITTAKKRDSLDWEGEAILHGIGHSTSVPRAGVDAGHIVVDSWNNIGKYIHVEGAFFIFDEQRLVGSGAWVKGFRAIAKKNNWILLSATPGDTWLDYIPVFVANGFYKNKTEFLRDHVVYSRFSKFPKVERYIAVNRLVKHRNALLVDMPYERHTNRIMHHIEVGHDETLYEKVVKKRWHVFESRPLRDVAELFSVMRKVANSDASRLATVRSLMKDNPKLIVFYNFDYELELLRSLAEGTTQTSASLKDASGSLVSTSGKSSEFPFETSQSSLPQEPIDPSTTGTSSRRSSSSPKQPSSRFESSDASLDSRMCPIRDCPDCARGSQSTSSVSKTTATGNATSLVAATSTVATGSFPSASTEEWGSSSKSEKETIPIAEWNGHKHEAIPKTDRWVYLVQYTAGAEGWNCIETDAVCFYSLNYSYRIFEQCQGRIDRLNTPFVDLHYYVLRSKATIDQMIWRALRVKKKFNEPKTEDALRGRFAAM